MMMIKNGQDIAWLWDFIVSVSFCKTSMTLLFMNLFYMYALVVHVFIHSCYNFNVINQFFPFFLKSEGTRNIVPLGTIPLATIEKFNKMVSYCLLLSLEIWTLH